MGSGGTGSGFQLSGRDADGATATTYDINDEYAGGRSPCAPSESASLSATVSA